MTKDEALTLALEALSSGEKMKADGIGWWEYDRRLVKQAIIAIKEALAQPAQEPVAWMCGAFDGEPCEQSHRDEWENPRYTTPPQRPWVGLTGQEIDDIDEANWEEDHKVWGIHEFARAIEAKLKEKNT